MNNQKSWSFKNLSLGSRKGYIFSGPNRSNSKCQPTKCPILEKPKWKTASDTRFSPGSDSENEPIRSLESSDQKC